MIPEYDALYDLKRQWYYEFVLFLSNQPGIDILILGGDVARRYVHQTFELEKRICERIIFTVCNDTNSSFLYLALRAKYIAMVDIV